MRFISNGVTVERRVPVLSRHEGQLRIVCAELPDTQLVEIETSADRVCRGEVRYSREYFGMCVIGIELVQTNLGAPAA